MSPQPAPSQDDPQIPETSDGPGGRLRLARQSRGLEIEQVAAQLHLAPAQITALETDAYDALPDPVFILGYMRNYARLLGLDPEPLLDAYRAKNPAIRPSGSRARPATQRQVRSNHLLVRLVSLAIAVAAVGLAFTWWQNEYGGVQQEPAPPRDDASVASGTPPAVAPFLLAPQEGGSDTRPIGEAGVAEPIEPPATGERAPSEPQPRPTSVDAGPSAESPGPPETDAPAAALQPAAPETAAGEDAEAAAPARGEIVVAFSGPCWVDIRDSERKFKLFGEMDKGDRHVLEGKPPYSVILGNAAAVEITVAGVPFDIEAVTRGNVARFTLDPD
jgi:cytoskeleton protein RodZ